MCGGRAIAHGLGVTPKLVIITQEYVWYQIWGGVDKIFFNNYNATGHYPVSAPDATNFYVGTVGDFQYSANLSGVTYYWVAYR